MKTAILASEHYFTQRSEAPTALWLSLDEAIKTETGYRAWLDTCIPVFMERQITRIFGLTDLTALVAAHCEFLLGYRTQESFLNIVLCLDKPRVRAIIGNTDYNVNVIDTFPAFVKPIHSSLSQGSGFVSTEKEYQEHIQLHSPGVYATTEKYRVFGKVANLDLLDGFHEFYGEELIPQGVQLTVDVIAHNGNIDVLSVSESVFHEGIPSFSYFDFPYGCSDEELANIHKVATEITDKLGLDNLLFNIEFILTNDGELKLIEVNPRPATQFIPAIKAVTGFDGWKYLESGEVSLAEPSAFNMAIKIFRTISDSEITSVPSEEVVAELKNRLGGHYNSFVDVGSMLSSYQQDGYTYRVGEAYLPYNTVAEREHVFKEALNILESQGSLINTGEII